MYAVLFNMWYFYVREEAEKKKQMSDEASCSELKVTNTTDLGS